MGCLRCGKETQNSAVFCEECTKCMEDYPIKPGTVVVLPQREPAHAEKKTKRKTKEEQKRKRADRKAKRKAGKRMAKKLSPTEQDNKQLRSMVRLLFVMALILLGMVCFLAYMLFSK